MMVEGEIDCLSVMQEAGDLVNCVATGSSAKGRSGRWITELSLPSFILQSFDEDSAGDDGAEFWLKTFKEQENIARWSIMTCNDPNVLLQTQGESYFTLREWVQLGVDLAKHDMKMQLQSIPLSHAEGKRLKSPLQGELAHLVSSRDGLLNNSEVIQIVSALTGKGIQFVVCDGPHRYVAPLMPHQDDQTREQVIGFVLQYESVIARWIQQGQPGITQLGTAPMALQAVEDHFELELDEEAIADAANW